MLTLATTILFLGPLLVVPLGLRLLKQANLISIETNYRSPATIIWGTAVVSLACSFSQPAGQIAALLAAPWFLATLLLALLGARYVLAEVRDLDAQLALAAALLLVAVGGGWTLVSRAGLRPANFSTEIVLLTGVHFHYAGFALPILTGWTVRHLQDQATPSPFWSSSLGGVLQRGLIASVVAGVPLVGIGITFSPLLEVLASGLLTLAALLLALMQIRVAVQVSHALRRSLLLISSVSLICGMTLAMTYALGNYLDTKWLDIPTMIPLHGIANSIGFSLCGLLAWNLPGTSAASDSITEPGESVADGT